ncbi:MAG TPA: sigma-70 family RNA polymerase sigma factor [Phycisphaerales bacterium]|nr:sigma-70 family RNA polymerase sigma factor [Phycisphaerales bacterium]
MPNEAGESGVAVTEILRAVGKRDSAAEELLSVVYDHLRAIARQRMAGERAGHTLQATALVHEAFLKLIGDEEVSWESRAHFYAAAAQAMRRILIDHARRRGADKRGGGLRRVPLSVVDLAAETDPEQIMALEEAMTELEQSDPRSASIVRLRFFAGLGVEETAAVLGLSERTVMRDWAYARAMLFERMSGEAPPAEVPDGH